MEYTYCMACDEIIGSRSTGTLSLVRSVCNNCIVMPKAKPSRPAWLSMTRMEMGTDPAMIANPMREAEGALTQEDNDG